MPDISRRRHGGVLFVQYVTFFSKENVKFWPVLTIFGYLVANVRTFWCPF